MKKGISVIVCCYNSAKRISKALQSICSQQVSAFIPVECILVDNACIDETVKIAKDFWGMSGATFPLKIVSEPRPGLSHARIAGINSANYECLIFCDDDNEFFSNYLMEAYTTLNSDKLVAACGGKGIPRFDAERPAWFSDYQEAFAVGSQEIGIEGGKLFQLYGAGLALRKSAFESLRSRGYEFVLEDRKGTSLSSSGDIELTNMLVLIGYELRYNSQMMFYHSIPNERLTTEYLSRLFHAFGTDGPIRNLFYAHITSRRHFTFIRNWNIHFALSIFRMSKYYLMPPKPGGRILYQKWSKAYCRSLLNLRGRYATLDRGLLALKKTSKAR